MRSGAARGRIRLSTLLLLLLALAVAVALRLNGSALARTIGAVPLIYLFSGIGTGLQYLRSPDRQSGPGTLPKTFAGLHLVMAGIFAPLWAGTDEGSALAILALFAPVIFYLAWALLRLRGSPRPRDPLAALLEVFVPNRMSRLLAAEIRVLTMALFAWSAPGAQADRPTFTSGSVLTPVLIAIAVLSIAEVAIVHLIVGQWSHNVAYVLTAIGLFMFVYLIGLAKSLRYMPSVLLPDGVLIRLGHFHSVEIPYAAIEAVRAVSAAPPKSVNLAPMSAPNLLIELSSEREMTGIGGKKRLFSKIAVRMDNPAGFEASLCDRLRSRPESSASASALAD